MIEYDILSTGSKGNCTVVNRSIVIDCGVPYKKLEPYINDIRVVILTHIHQDHFNPATIKRLAAKRPSLRFVCGAWMVDPLLDIGIRKENIDFVFHDVLYEYSDFSVMPFSLMHDVENFGYRIFFADCTKMIYATDTAEIKHVEAPMYDLYLVEANYTESDMQARIDEKMASGGYIYEYRARKNHLSKEKCDEWLDMNVGPFSEVVYMHQHED